MIGSPGGQGLGGRGEVIARLRLVATADLHLHLLPHDYYADRPLGAIGLARLAPLLRRLRAEVPGSLLLDDGDSLQGNLLGDWLAAEGRGRPHPMIAAMNALGYDAATLGNHEFNHGLDYLRRALGEARFPVVSANLLGRDGPLVPPWALLRRQVVGSAGPLPLAVGVVGFGPPQVAAWEGHRLGGAVVARDILEAAAEEVPRLRAAGAELVVALCHAGLGPAFPEPMMEDAAIPLAALPGIDALVLGHTHAVVPGPPDPREEAPGPGVDRVGGRLHGRPAVQPGAYGSHAGVIDLDLAGGPGAWRVAAAAARVVPCPEGPLDPEVEAAALPTHRALRAAARRPLGETAVPLRSYFSLVAADATLDVVADAQRAEAWRLLRGTPGAGLPVLSAVAPFKAGGRGGPRHYIDLEPGPLTLGQAAELYIHPNDLVVVETTGAGLRAWLERSAALFLQIEPGRGDQPLIDPRVPSYNFDVLDGLSWRIDPTAPPATDPEGRPLSGPGRVRDLRHDGRPVRDDDRFAVATNSYRVGTGGGFAAATRARVIARSPRAVRDLVLAEVRAGPVRPAPRPRWGFAAPPGTGAHFLTGPGALAHPGGPEGRDLRPLGPGERGFWRFGIAF